MSQKAKNSPKPAPTLNIEQIKQALKSGKNSEIKLEDIDVHNFKSASTAVLKRINALKNEQLKFTEIEAKFFEELHALECKYHKMYEPIFEKRRQIVNGEYEPTEEETKWTLDEINGHDHEEAKKEEAAGEEKKEEKKEDEIGIPNFWLETLQSMKMTSELIQEHDEPILAYLEDIRVKFFEQKPYGYTLEFHFGENPFFTSKVLTKTYELKIEVDSKDPFSFEGPDLDKVVGCKIDWKPNKNVTVKQIKKKLKSKNKKAPPKIITKEEKQDSFFNFFDTPKSEKNKAAANSDDKTVALKNDHADEDEEDDDDNEDLYMFADFEIGQQIREKVVPKAVLYFTGELDDMDDDEYDDYDDEDEEEEDEDEHDEDEDDEDDDDDDGDDDNDDHGKKGGKNKKQAIMGKQGGVGKAGSGAGAGAGAGGNKHPGGGKGGEPTPSECKQT